MDIIAHRGFWGEGRPKNSRAAFQSAFDFGFGVETDVRDFNGDLVISHDIPLSGCMPFSDFLDLYKQSGSPGTLALNIKSDGLQDLLAKSLSTAGVSRYFVFDMSVPDGLGYLKKGLNVFTRQSEFERDLAFYDEAVGVWLDEFQRHWISDSVLDAHVLHQKACCIVSPELHGRDYEAEWEHYRSWINRQNGVKLGLCTDDPGRAKTYFLNP